MGLISEIKKKRGNEIKNEIDSPTVRRSEVMPEVAAPCVACRCPRSWWDVSGGGPHCAGCQPPPALGLVARTRDVVMLPGGSLAWLDELPPADQSEVDLDREFEQRYRCYVTRDGKRSVIERRDWKAIDSAMIVR